MQYIIISYVISLHYDIHSLHMYNNYATYNTYAIFTIYTNYDIHIHIYIYIHTIHVTLLPTWLPRGATDEVFSDAIFIFATLTPLTICSLHNIYIYIYVYILIYIHMYICVYIYMHMYIHIYVISEATSLRV